MVGRLQPGTRVAGRYTILGELGQGGNASVHRAYDVRLNTEVALKVLWPQLATDATFVERFRREAQTLARLSHPNIVRMFELGEDDDLNLYYLVLEYMSGGSLRQQLGPVPWSLEAVLALLGRVGSAIDYAHTREPSVIHRDLKPSNILFNAEGRPVVSDFGLARLLVSDSAEPTLTGKFALGTPSYMAPEQIHGRAEPASDRYALAVIAYELLVGRVPHQGDTPLETLLLVSTTPAPPANRFNPAIEASVVEVLQKALDPEPELRFRAATEFLAALGEAGAHSLHRARGQGVAPGDIRIPLEVPTLGTPPPGVIVQPPERETAEPTAVPVATPLPTGHSRRRFGGLPAVAVGGAVAVIAVAATAATALTARGPATEAPSPEVLGARALPPAVVVPSSTTTPQPTPTMPAPTATPTSRPSATRGVALPLATATPSEAQQWETLLSQVDPMWGTDWAGFTQTVASFVGQHPDFAPAKDKLYAALVEYGKDLISQGAFDRADAVLKQAQTLLPDRGEAFSAAAALTPTATPTPTPTHIPAPTSPPPSINRVAVPASTPRPTVPPAPAVPPTKVPFQP